MIVDFTPVASASAPPFQFQATFDGTLYTVTITWNLFAQRYYFSIFTLGGQRIVTAALVGSLSNNDVDLVQGYFADSVMVFRAAAQQFEVLP